ncbi:polar localization protein TipN [Phenylobacterium sp.]|uniref:polar localization protein TipN n=1 Tax=Phenylobacterium sp. TaxID=1871053 RepID=UPI00289F7608|nr:polar localization protein TipN [Phenylobacterium sp.]
MKIKKRHQPVDFQSLDGEGAAAPEPAAAIAEAEADQAFSFAPPPVGDLAVEAKAATPLTARAATTPRIPLTPATSVSASSGWTIYLTAFVVSVLWACAPIAFAWGYRRSVAPFDFEPFAMVVFALLAIGPAALVWVLAYMVRQGQLLGAEARRTKALADEMTTPAMAAGAQTIDLVQAMRDEIARAGAAAQEARDTIIVLRQALAGESEGLAAAAANAARTAQGLSETLGRERTELGGLAQTLDAQAAAVADAITRQAKMVGEASDLAEAQLREAEASLAARAADLAAAAGETSDVARTAAEDLTRHIARLETAGLGVTEQIGSVEKGLTEQRASLVTAAHALRADQEGFSAQAETHAAQLAEFIAQARLSAAEMGDRAVKGGEALRQLMSEAADQFRDLAETAKAERDEFGQSTLHSVEAVARAAAAERARLEEQTRATIAAMTQAAEETRQAAARHAETARDQVDQLSEAAFTAGQQANKVFEARLAEARALIEQSAQMVEQAGAATTRKLDEGARAARAALDELTGMLGEIEDRATKLPAAARDRAEEVRMAVAESIDDLMDHARRTADETQAIDEAFQERVRRNYDMLSEAVRLMGSVATSASLTPPAPRERPERVSLRASLAKEAAPVVEAEAAEAPADDHDELELNEPIPPPPVADKAAKEIRPRLRLTPTATDTEFATVFEQAAGRHEDPAGEGWTWRDLLSSLEEPDEAEEVRHPPLEETLAAEIGAMGIDPTALLPRSRIHELAVALQVRDLDGARAVVRKLAPAATRRLTRKLLTDDLLKRQVLSYLARYHELLEDAAERDPEGFLIETLLSSEAGRTYLLFDAAAGDLT